MGLRGRDWVGDRDWVGIGDASQREMLKAETGSETEE